MNNVNLLGRLTSDPELRQTQSGVSSCRFTIAVNRPFKNKQTGEFEADFISCMAWRNTAEFISKYFYKGKMIAVSGSLRTGSYQDKNHSDVTHYTTDVMVDEAYFCGDKGNAQPQQQAAPQYSNHNAMEAAQNYGNLSDFEEILSDGDVPF
jgi:single-strand DNA-binding protein